MPKKVRAKVRRIRQKYSGEVGKRFGPTLAGEHLASEDGIELSTTTVRRWMLGEGLWSRERKARQHRQRRERRAHFGELVQLDGSFHDWLEGRGPRGCLMNLVDDAPPPRCAGWASRKPSGRRWTCCAPGWGSTECRGRCIRIGR